jgi:hypothetical protein
LLPQSSIPCGIKCTLWSWRKLLLSLVGLFHGLLCLCLFCVLCEWPMPLKEMHQSRPIIMVLRLSCSWDGWAWAFNLLWQEIIVAWVSTSENKPGWCFPAGIHGSKLAPGACGSRGSSQDWSDWPQYPSPLSFCDLQNI